MKTINPHIQEGQTSLSTRNIFFKSTPRVTVTKWSKSVMQRRSGERRAGLQISHQKQRVRRHWATSLNCWKKCFSWNSIPTENIFQKQSWNESFIRNRKAEKNPSPAHPHYRKIMENHTRWEYGCTRRRASAVGTTWANMKDFSFFKSLSKDNCLNKKYNNVACV